MKFSRYIFLLGLLAGTKAQAQEYIDNAYVYFSTELNYGDTVSREHADSVSLALELSTDSLRAIDTIVIVVNDSLGNALGGRTIAVVAGEDSTLFYDRVWSSKLVRIDYPHVFRINLTVAQMPLVRQVMTRFRLKTGSWTDVVNQTVTH